MLGLTIPEKLLVAARYASAAGRAGKFQCE
jgi:hypothetical protein